MANETILIVDADTKSQKVLEVSFKKAGYRVVMTDGPMRARELVQDASPDIIISDTAFPGGGDGFEFLADLKSGSHKGVPFIFLTEERSLPQKMKGFELGADDYLTKPIYIKEVTTRVELLLQKRAKEALSEDDVEEIEGNVADITMIDLLQTIEEELRSGTIHLTRENQSAVIYFREGNILDAICGKLQGEEAIYRLMLWPDGEFLLRYHDQVRRMDRIEKDSGALLLEGIRRLDKYNELVDQLPNLGRIFEADYPRLTKIAGELPDEVSRVVRLFDGLRSIREVCEGSPLDDVTTLKIVEKLVEDHLLVDVTPEKGGRAEKRSRSNLAAWLEGVRTTEPEPEVRIAREDTSPKFGSSITEMVEKRSPDRPERGPNDSGRKTLDQVAPRPLRQTDPFAGLPFEDEDDETEGRDARRKTHLQWDIRPKSDWNIHYDEPVANPSAAIREIEEEERRRRELEARQLAESSTASEAEDVSAQRQRDSTLRFAPTIDRQADSLNNDLLQRIEEDERRRRDEEARRLEAQLKSLEPVEGPLSPALRRRTDELPAQPRVPSAIEEDPHVDTDELFPKTAPNGSEERPVVRERINTPLRTPAFATLEESSDPRNTSPSARPMISGDVSEPPPLGDAVSEADLFEDEPSEGEEERPERVTLDLRSERVTLDLRPPAELTPLGVETSEPEVTPEVDPGGLFDNLGDDDTAPGDENYEILEVEVLEKLPSVERQARDRELVRARYDLSRRKTVTPFEIEGREPLWERPTVELPATDSRSETTTAERSFFDDADTPRDYTDFDHPTPKDYSTEIRLVGVLIALVLVVIAALVLFSDKTPEEPVELADQKTEVVEPEPPEPPVVEPTPEEPEEPGGLEAPAATAVAEEYGEGVGAASAELATVMSGNVLGTTSEQPAVAVNDTPPASEQPAIREPEQPKEKEPIERPKVDERPPVEDTPPPVKEPVAKVEVPSSVSPAQIREAERLIKREKYEEALALLRALSQAAPEDKQVAYLHGTAAFGALHNGEAIQYLSKAERLGHRTAQLYIDLGAAYQLDRKPQKARWAYEKSLKIQPNGREADEVRTILSTQF